MKHSILISALAAFAANDLAAQACALGPGEVYGVTAYQCANCGFKRDNAQRATYIFYAEPVVQDAKMPGLFRTGDVIEAVDGQPITTTAGAELFTYPAIGAHEISVRRGRVRQTLHFSISGSGCESTSKPGSTTGIRFNVDDIETIEVIKGPAASERYSLPVPNTGVVVITTRPGNAVPRTGVARESIRNAVADILGRTPGNFEGRQQPIFIVDGVQISPAEAQSLGVPVDRTGRFGFAVGCERGCHPATSRDGPLIYTYYIYTEFPSIMAVRPGGAAERAGLRAGDIVTKIDGISLGEDEGGKKLARLERVDHARVTVRRDGKEMEFTLNADR
jgi:hypothetical protein